MLNRNHIACRALAVLIGPALLFVLGCSGDDGLATRYAVSGTVNYNGKPLEKGRINFIPKARDARPASGKIANGSFTLTTLTTDDGAVPGEYKVSVDTKEFDEAAAKAESEKLAQKHGLKGMGPQMPPEVLATLNKKAKSTIPEKYSNPDKSELTATVKASSNSFTFDLKN